VHALLAVLALFVVAVVLVVLGLVALVAGPALAFRVALGLALFVFPRAASCGRSWRPRIPT
jgi:hypothetical protein